MEANRHLKIVKERITTARRDLRKFIITAVGNDVVGDWLKIEYAYVATMTCLRQAKTLEQMTAILQQLDLLKEQVVNLLERHVNLEESVTNHSEYRQHI